MEQVGDEAVLEGELEAHLEENRASLQAVEEALAADVENSELIMVNQSSTPTSLSMQSWSLVWETQSKINCKLF